MTRPDAYKIGQLLAVGEIAANREHDGKLMTTAFGNPAQLIATLSPFVAKKGGWHERRWVAVMNDLTPEAISKRGSDPMAETQLALGYWHERTHIHRAQEAAQIRSKSDLSRVDFAARIGVSSKLIEGWEYHTRNISEEDLKLLQLAQERQFN